MNLADPTEKTKTKKQRRKKQKKGARRGTVTTDMKGHDNKQCLHCNTTDYPDCNCDSKPLSRWNGSQQTATPTFCQTNHLYSTNKFASMYVYSKLKRWEVLAIECLYITIGIVSKPDFWTQVVSDYKTKTKTRKRKMRWKKNIVN